MRTLKRERNLLLSEPFDSFKIHLLLSKSVRDHDHIFVKPFNSSAWLAILGSALLVVPIFYLINVTSSHYQLEDDRPLAGLSTWRCLGASLSRLLAPRLGCPLGAGEGKPLPANGASESPATIQADPSAAFKSMLLRREQRYLRRQQMRRWRLERRRARRLGRATRRTGFFKLAYVAWYVIGSLLTQGGETEDLPRANSTRILVAFWWLYLIVICSIHSGILTAILTFPKQNDFIQTLDDFLALEQSERLAMKLAVDKHSELGQFVSSGDNLHKSPLQALFSWPKMQPIVQVDFKRHRQRILDEVQRGQSAFMEEKSTINLIISQEYFDTKPPKCLLKASRHPIDIVPMSLVLSDRLSATCVQAINKLLARLMRTGLAQKWRRKFEVQGNDCLNAVVINAGDVDKIELRHVALALWFLGAGLALGALCLMLEVVWLFTTDLEAELVDTDSSSSGRSSKRPSEASESSSSDLNWLEGNERLALRLGHRARFRPPKVEVMPAKVDSRLALVWPRGPALRAGKPNVEPHQTRQTGRAERKRRRLERAAERRARRLRRTMELVRRLHKGKVYSGFILRVSDRLQARARRASMALVHRLAGGPQQARLRISQVEPLGFEGGAPRGPLRQRPSATAAQAE